MSKHPWGIAYRPVELQHMIGNESVLNRLDDDMKSGNISNRIGLFGFTGTGKTTLSYILAEYFTGQRYDPDSSSLCVHEINCASDKGIDNIRDLIENVKMSPMFGKRHVVILDEVQDLTPSAMKALYKPLESESEVVWILLTDQPHRLTATIRGRLNIYKLDYPTPDDLIDYAEWICKKEKRKFDEKVATYIANTCTGNVRLFLNTLQDVVHLTNVGKKDIDEAIHRNLDEGMKDNLENIVSIVRGDGPLQFVNVMEVYVTWQMILLYALAKRSGMPNEENYYGNLFYGKLDNHVENRDLLSTLKMLNRARLLVIQGGIDGKAAFAEAFFRAEEKRG